MDEDSIERTENSEHVQLVGLPDAGASTLERYRYQFTYTAMVAIQMYKDPSAYKEIYCEHMEDIVILLQNDLLIGIQVKTRDLIYGPFSLFDDEMMKAIVKFIELDRKNPNRFEKFVIVANCKFLQNDKGIPYWTSQLKEKEPQNMDSMNKMVNKFISKWDKLSEKKKDKIVISSHEIVSLLKKLRCENGPAIDGIHEKALNHLKDVEFQGNDSYYKLDKILRNIVSQILFRSSKEIQDSIPAYCNFLDSRDVTKKIDEVSSKRITVEIMSAIIKNEEEIIFLGTKDRSNSKFKGIGSMYLMAEKMKNGGIDLLDIDQIEILSYEAENYIIEQISKYPSRLYLERIEQIKKILINVAVEARSRSNLNSGMYGTIMLHIIEDNIKEISKVRHQDVFNTPYEILKGFIGIITSDCQIQFSDNEVKI